MDETKNGQALQPQQPEAAPDLAPVQNVYTPSIWNDKKMLESAVKAAKVMAASDIVPEQTYRGKPENCLIAIDMANRLGLSPLTVMQNLYIVKGKPGWSGQFCIAAINSSGRFSPLEFVTSEDGSCYAKATNLQTGRVCCGTVVTWDMVKAEGWLSKNGSKWATMPAQMFMYRAAAFFARVYCPEVLFGLQTADEIRDTNGYEDEAPKKVTVISLEDA